MKKLFSILLSVVLIMTIVLSFSASAKSYVKEIEEVKVESVQGSPAIMIYYKDGSKEIFNDLAYTNFETMNNADQVTNMINSGFKGFSISLPFPFLGASNADEALIWAGYDNYRFETFNKRLSTIIDNCPDAKIQFRIDTTSPPDWWLKANPGQECKVLMPNGQIKTVQEVDMEVRNRETVRSNYVSLYSQKWIQDVGKAISDVVKYAEEKYPNNIVGYVMMGLGSGEMYYANCSEPDRFGIFGYDEHSLDAYRKWLADKYKTDKALQDAWNKNDVTLETAYMPTFEDAILYPNWTGNRKGNYEKDYFRDMEKHKYVIDYYIFINESIPIMNDAIGKYIKQTAPNKVLGTFTGFMYEFSGYPMSGTLQLERAIKSDVIDYFQVTASYNSRTSGTGGECFRAPAYSARLNGVPWIEDNDLVTYLETGEPSDRLGYTPNMQLSLEIQKRAIGYAIANAQGSNYMDLHYVNYQDEELRLGMKQIENVYKDSFNYNRTSAAQILIISNEESNMYLGTGATKYLTDMMYKSPQEWVKIGAPVDVILVNDIDKIPNINQYKLIVFNNTYRLSDKQIDMINKKVKGGGRTLVFTWAPGFYKNDDKSIENMEALTGFDFVNKEWNGGETFTLNVSNNNNLFFKNLYECGNNKIEIWKNNINTNSVFQIQGNGIIPFIYDDTSKTAVAGYKQMSNNGGWNSVYWSSSYMFAAHYTALAKAAGVHIYGDKIGKDIADTIYANKSYIIIHGNNSRTRNISLPAYFNVYDAMTNQKLFTNVNEFSRFIKNGYTEILRLEFVDYDSLYMEYKNVREIINDPDDITSSITSSDNSSSTISSSNSSVTSPGVNSMYDKASSILEESNTQTSDYSIWFIYCIFVAMLIFTGVILTGFLRRQLK